MGGRQDTILVFRLVFKVAPEDPAPASTASTVSRPWRPRREPTAKGFVDDRTSFTVSARCVFD